MEVKEVNSSSAYGKPPWVFKGSALYQLHLVKAETARAFIPKEFKLVEAFGYTLGGFFLANYDESPAGTFDEVVDNYNVLFTEDDPIFVKENSVGLVVIAGIVWNPPTSCAWAAQVLVNSEEACAHGRKDVGLPSQIARFSKRITAIPRNSHSKISKFLNKFGFSTASRYTKSCKNIQVSEIKGPAVTDLCTINLNSAGVAKFDPGKVSNKFTGPVIKMSLPSFRIRSVQPAKVSGPSTSQEDEIVEQSYSRNLKSTKLGERERELCISVLLSKPILALEFSSLNMQVHAPVVVSHSSSKNAPTCS